MDLAQRHPINVHLAQKHQRPFGSGAPGRRPFGSEAPGRRPFGPEAPRSTSIWPISSWSTYIGPKPTGNRLCRAAHIQQAVGIRHVPGTSGHIPPQDTICIPERSCSTNFTGETTVSSGCGLYIGTEDRTRRNVLEVAGHK